MALRDGESIVHDTPHLPLLHLHGFIFQLHESLVGVYDSVYKLVMYYIYLSLSLKRLSAFVGCAGLLASCGHWRNGPQRVSCCLLPLQKQHR